MTRLADIVGLVNKEVAGHVVCSRASVDGRPPGLDWGRWACCLPTWSLVHGNMRCMTPTADLPTLAILLDAHDEQVGGTIATRLPTGWVPEWDGPCCGSRPPCEGLGSPATSKRSASTTWTPSSGEHGTSSHSGANRSSGRHTATIVQTWLSDCS